MACEICKREGCTRMFHSLKEQEFFDTHGYVGSEPEGDEPIEDTDSTPDYPTLLARCKPWVERLHSGTYSAEEIAEREALLADLEKAGV